MPSPVDPFQFQHTVYKHELKKGITPCKIPDCKHCSQANSHAIPATLPHCVPNCGPKLVTDSCIPFRGSIETISSHRLAYSTVQSYPKTIPCSIQLIYSIEAINYFVFYKLLGLFSFLELIIAIFHLAKVSIHKYMYNRCHTNNLKLQNNSGHDYGYYLYDQKSDASEIAIHKFIRTIFSILPIGFAIIVTAISMLIINPMICGKRIEKLMMNMKGFRVLHNFFSNFGIQQAFIFIMIVAFFIVAIIAVTTLFISWADLLSSFILGQDLLICSAQEKKYNYLLNTIGITPGYYTQKYDTMHLLKLKEYHILRSTGLFTITCIGKSRSQPGKLKSIIEVMMLCIASTIALPFSVVETIIQFFVVIFTIVASICSKIILTLPLLAFLNGCYAIDRYYEKNKNKQHNTCEKLKLLCNFVLYFFTSFFATIIKQFFEVIKDTAVAVSKFVTDVVTVISQLPIISLIFAAVDYHAYNNLAESMAVGERYDNKEIVLNENNKMMENPKYGTTLTVSVTKTPTQHANTMPCRSSDEIIYDYRRKIEHYVINEFSALDKTVSDMLLKPISLYNE